MADTSIDVRLLEPYYAGLSGKTPEERSVIQRRIDELPETSKDFLFSDELADGLEKLVRQYRVSERFYVAIGKIVFLVILGDVALTAVPQLLQRVGFDTAVATALSSELSGVLQPLVAARALQAAPQGMRQLQPLTRRIGVPAPPSTARSDDTNR